jgi:DNA modification methylase
MSEHLIQANALNIPLADCSVQMCVTSPPYYGLRDYGTAEWVGGDAECDHKIDNSEQMNTSTLDGSKRNCGNALAGYKHTCGKCGAVRVDNQLGLEQTPEEYVANMVSVFREVRRVLKDDGILWLVIGDSYNGSGGAGGDYGKGGLKEGQPKYPGRNVSTLKPKDLIGIPWRVAFALQADGWWLRSDCIWDKPNPMPESVTDRPTKAHEYIFLLTKSARYYYDHEAIMEHLADATIQRNNYGWDGNGKGIYSIGRKREPGDFGNPETGRNKRTVWHVATAPYKGSHYATYPPKLIEPCILAGTSEKGHCPKCGALWERVIERTSKGKSYSTGKSEDKNKVGLVTAFSGYDDGSSAPTFVTIGWQPTCDCGAEPVPDIVFDPFNGSGTTGLVARKHGRNYIGTDLSLEYIHQAEERLSHTALKNWQHGKTVEATDLGPLFEVIG